MRRHPIWIAAATAAAAALALAATASAGGGFGGPTFGYGKHVAEARALGFCARFGKQHARYRACISEQATKLVLETRDPARELPRIDAYVHGVGGFLQSNCHILMHPVGRRYARATHLTLARLRDSLPRSNDPGCSAGFSHGMLMALGPQIVRLGPRGAAKECRRAATRYQSYSCIHGLGHAYMRLFDETFQPALAACHALGRDDAVDCAQGAFHDYWIAVAGLDATHHPKHVSTSPRRVCGSQPATFVRACWYRALLERPPPKPVTSASRVLAVCAGLRGLQHSGCVTGASLIVSSDPFDQLRVCAGLRGGDAASCFRGVRVPGVALAPTRDRLRLIRGCANVDHAAQRDCYEWLGKALNVVTDGKFAAAGCPALRYAATRAACRAGARGYAGALETFS